MSKNHVYIISKDTPDDMEVSTASAAKFLGIKPHTLRLYRTTQMVNIPYFKNPGVRGRVTYLVSDLRSHKQNLKVDKSRNRT